MGRSRSVHSTIIKTGSPMPSSKSKQRDRVERKIHTKKKKMGWVKWYTRWVKTPIGAIVSFFVLMTIAICVLRGPEEARQILLERLKHRVSSV